MESPSATKAQAQEKHNESKVQKDIESTNPPQEDVKCEELKPHLTVETPAEDPAPAPSEVGAKIHVTLELSKLKHNVNNFRLVYNAKRYLFGLYLIAHVFFEFYIADNRLRDGIFGKKNACIVAFEASFCKHALQTLLYKRLQPVRFWSKTCTDLLKNIQKLKYF